ncbi:hypothetical protein M513_06364 [Trichuris suis]|uniref:EGF-like domain protein n=1 Tax=Trichuris suis TaxID=68888 RepID=A0A085M662_9BILA|nr:hypothetical protein M513_06364 [Trichuris suis]
MRTYRQRCQRSSAKAKGCQKVGASNAFKVFRAPSNCQAALFIDNYSHSLACFYTGRFHTNEMLLALANFFFFFFTPRPRVVSEVVNTTSLHTACRQDACQNGGTCIETGSGTECRCPPGFAGLYCEDVGSPCHPNPCYNSGICTYTNSKDGRLEVTCRCPVGTSGKNCEINYDDCYADACYHNGTCVDGIGDFDCICPPGFAGERCEMQTNECTSSPCSSDGTVRCTQIDNSFSCVCGAGYTGYRCDVLVNFCSQKPCKNNGTCMDVLQVCICRQGYTGEVCDEKIPEECMSNPCLNGGNCLPGQSPSEPYFCDCLAGTSGKHCELKYLTSCLVNGCLNGGTCESQKGAFVCRCPPHFTGAQCHIRDTSFLQDVGMQSDINAVELGSNPFNDSDKKYICSINECHIKANNGLCNPECNSYLCNFDGIDCAGNLEPFHQCSNKEYCANVFRNELCDPQCNTEDCLFDGFDCFKIENDYVRNSEQYCEWYAGDGSCNEECNMTAYNFDGGDCLTDKQRISGQLSGRIAAVVAVSSVEFEIDLGRFLIVLGNLVQAIVRVDTDKQGRKMIYQWNSKSASVDGDFSAAHLRTRMDETPLLKFPQSTLVVLTVHKIPYNNASLFTDSSRVIDFLSVDPVKRIVKRQLGYELRSVSTVEDNENGARKILLTIIGLFIGTICVIHFIILTLSNKRVRAKIWFPPTELEMTELAGTSRATAAVEPVETERSASLVPAAIGRENGSGEEYNENEVVEINNKLLLAWLKSNDAADPYGCNLSREEERKDEFQNTVVILSKEGLNCLLIRATTDSFSDPETQCAVIDELISSGAEINNHHGLQLNTPLITAVRNKHIAAIALLLSRGADPNLKDIGGRTALHHAVSVNCSEIVLLLLNSGQCHLEEKDFDGCTATLLAAKQAKESFPIFCLLVDCGARLMVADDEGRSCTHWAAQNNNVLILTLLWLRDALCYSKDILGRNALFLAASENCVEAVEFLDARGFDRKARDVLNRSPLQVATNNGHGEVVKLLQAPQPKATRLDEITRRAVMEELTDGWKKKLDTNKRESWTADHSQRMNIVNSTSNDSAGNQEVTNTAGEHENTTSPELIAGTESSESAQTCNLQGGLIGDIRHEFHSEPSRSPVLQCPDWMQRSDFLADLPFIFQDKFQSHLWKLRPVGGHSHMVSESGPRPDNISFSPVLYPEHSTIDSEVSKQDERILSCPDFVVAQDGHFNGQVSKVTQMPAMQPFIPMHSSQVPILNEPCSFGKTTTTFGCIASSSESSDGTPANMASHFPTLRHSNSSVSEDNATCFIEKSARLSEETYLHTCPSDTGDLYTWRVEKAADDCTILVNEERATSITHNDSVCCKSMEKPTEGRRLDNSQMTAGFVGGSSAVTNLDLDGPSVTRSSPSFVPVSSLLHSTHRTGKMRQGRYIKKASLKNMRYSTSSHRKQ